MPTNCATNAVFGRAKSSEGRRDHEHHQWELKVHVHDQNPRERVEIESNARKFDADVPEPVREYARRSQGRNEYEREIDATKVREHSRSARAEAAKNIAVRRLNRVGKKDA